LFSDLDKIGGLFPLIWELSNADERIRTTSAWVLGKANQNNVLVQNQVLPAYKSSTILYGDSSVFCVYPYSLLKKLLSIL
jgi:hypothetical protein